MNGAPRQIIIDDGTLLIAETYTAYLAAQTGRSEDEVRKEVQRVFSGQLLAREKETMPKAEATPVDPNYLPSNADLGFPPTFRGFRSADFFAEKLSMTVEEVQRLYRDEREQFHQLIDQHGLRITVKPEDL